MELEEITKLYELFVKNSNLVTSRGSGIPSHLVKEIALAATVVDFMKGIPKEMAHPVEISYLIPKSEKLYTALDTLGCSYLEDVTEWRKASVSEKTFDIQVKVKGRFATLPSGMSVVDMRMLKKEMNKVGLPFPEVDGIAIDK